MGCEVKSVIACKTQADKFGTQSVSYPEPATRGYANSGTKKARRLLLEAPGKQRDVIMARHGCPRKAEPSTVPLKIN
jgi:hypothetical protein